MAAHPTPGAALFGGAEDGRAGILYQQNWRGGVLSNVPGCATALDQGGKVPVLDYPLQDFLRVYGLPTWANTLPIKLHLTKAAAKAGFPERFPIGLVRFGNWLSLAVLPVEMTTAMGHQLKREFPSET